MIIGKRKLIAFVVGTISNSILAAMGVIDSVAYTGVAIALVGGFFTANVVAKARA